MLSRGAESDLWPASSDTGRKKGANGKCLLPNLECKNIKINNKLMQLCFRIINCSARDWVG